MSDSFREEEFNEQVKEELAKFDEQEVSTETEHTEEVQEPQYTEEEQEAMKAGWDPKFEGDNKVSAKEFIRVGQIIEAKRKEAKRADSATREVQELTTTVKKLVEHNKNLAKASYEQALRDIQSAKEQAYIDGDIEAYQAAEQKAQTITPPPEITPEPAVISSEAHDFQERNTWLRGSSPEEIKMQALTRATLRYLEETDPNISETDAIKIVENEIKEKFSHRFENQKQKAPALVAKSTVSGSSAKQGLAQYLTREQKAVLYNIQKADPSFTAEELAQQLEKTGKLNK